MGFFLAFFFNNQFSIGELGFRLIYRLTAEGAVWNDIGKCHGSCAG
jgi:hypothetical protein